MARRRTISLVALNRDREHEPGYNLSNTYGLYVLTWYARQDALVRQRCDFAIRDVPFEARQGPAVQALVREPVDVLGLSCSTLSTAWVERVIEASRAVDPERFILLGGDFVSVVLGRGRVPMNERVVVFPWGTGRTEEPFLAVMRALAATGTLTSDDLERIPGITWWSSDGARHDNPPGEYVPLSRIASPYLAGEPPMPTFGDFLFVRAGFGCLSKCRFCIWGGKGHGVRTIDWPPLERVRGELALAARAGVRDVEVCAEAVNYNEPFLLELLDALDSDTLARNRATVSIVLKTSHLTEAQTRAFLRQPDGLLMLLCGIQSLEPKAASASGRKSMPLDEIRRTLAPLAGHHPIKLPYLFPLPHEPLPVFQKNVERLLTLPNVAIEVNQLLTAPHLEFGRTPERWGYRTEEIEGISFASACEGFPEDDVLRAQEWLRSLSDATDLRIWDAEQWRRRSELEPAVEPGREGQAVVGVSGIFQISTSISTATANRPEPAASPEEAHQAAPPPKTGVRGLPKADQERLKTLVLWFERRGVPPVFAPGKVLLEVGDPAQQGGRARVEIRKASDDPCYALFGSLAVSFSGPDPMTPTTRKLLVAVARLLSPQAGSPAGG